MLPLGVDATTAALDEGLAPQRTLALDPLFLDRQATLMTTPVTAAEMRDAAWAALAASGLPVSVIHDSPGFVVQRVLAMIVNIACDIAQQRVATPRAALEAGATHLVIARPVVAADNPLLAASAIVEAIDGVGRRA